MNGAIETVYKGCRFRSRLEARWAVFFDALGVEWEYEPQGFEKQMAWGGSVRYLPDFYLPRTETWVEVKGSLSLEDTMKMRHMVVSRSPLPGLDDSANSEGRGLLVLGPIPEFQNVWPAHTLVVQEPSGGVGQRRVFFMPKLGMLRVHPTALQLMCLKDGVDKAPTWGVRQVFDPSPLLLPAKRTASVVQAAYTAARSARFEFGESGAHA